MKINLQQTDIVTNIDISDRIDIQIQNSAKIVNLLTKNLYSQPWKSCVRELITNAIDANIAAGKADTPIEIEFNPPDRALMGGFLKISDRGNGMSPETIRNILATLGVSTKDGDNQQHGGFGIGILSLFSVAPQAQLDTCSEGVCYRYLLLIDEIGIPCLKLLDRYETTESGTSITVPIADEVSAGEVARAISFYRPFIDPRPIYRGMDLGHNFLADVFNCSIDRIDGPGFSYYIDTSERASGVTLALKIGQIVYELEDSHFLKLGKSSPALGQTIDTNIRSQMLVIDIPIGSLDLPSSRENLADTPKNTEIIAVAVANAVDLARAEISKNINSPDSIFRDRNIVALAYFCRDWGIESMQWQGLEVPASFFLREFDYFCNTDGVNYQYNLKIKLEIHRHPVIALLDNYREHPDYFFIYIGDRQYLRASIRKIEPAAFASPIVIFTFEVEAEYLTWVEKSPALLALMPDIRIVRKQTRAIKGDRVKPSDLDKLKKWQASPKGLYRLILDEKLDYDHNWRSFATKLEAFPKNCIYVLASDLESEKYPSLHGYRNLLKLLEINDIEIVVATKSVEEKMALSKSQRDDTFASFVNLTDYVDRIALAYLQKHSRLFDRLQCLPLADSYNHHSIDRYLTSKREYIESLDLVLRAERVAAVVDREKLDLLRFYRSSLPKSGAIVCFAYQLKLNLVRSFWVAMERQSISPDPYLKKTFAWLFSEVLERYPSLNFLPCFCSLGEQESVMVESFLRFLGDLDKLPI